jgi:NADH dehydrogenase
MQRKTTPELVTVFGASGAVGRHVVRALARRGYRVRAAVRNPNTALFLQPLGNVGQIEFMQANLRVRWSVDRAIEGASHVVNLVGILHEGGRQTFDAVQDFGARAVAEAARAEGASLVHMSAIGADPDSEAGYAASKGRAEIAVREIIPAAVIVRPSIIFGPEDGFYNRFASMARLSPFLPLIGGGHTRFQPVYVGDVAELIARAVEGSVKPGQTYELGGPEVKTFRECLEEMLKVIGRERMLVNIPWSVARIQGAVLGLLPNPLLTSGQVKMLEVDTIVSEQAIKEGRTLEGVGIVPQGTDAILPGYLWRFRETGQYASPAAS